MSVYFIVAPGKPHRAVKIGYTARDARKRLKDYATYNPHSLDLLAVHEGGRDVELSLHRRFARHRIEGASREWFWLVPEIFTYAMGNRSFNAWISSLSLPEDDPRVDFVCDFLEDRETLDRPLLNYDSFGMIRNGGMICSEAIKQYDYLWLAYAPAAAHDAAICCPDDILTYLNPKLDMGERRIAAIIRANNMTAGVTQYPAAVSEPVRATATKSSRRPNPWLSIIARTLGNKEGKIASTDVWNIVGCPKERRDQEANTRMGSAMRELGWSRKKARIYGRVASVYAKGVDQERRIYVIPGYGNIPPSATYTPSNPARATRPADASTDEGRRA